MSYSMSPPAQKPPPYPPYQHQASSPTAQSPYGAPPPAKRQRLSPDIRSPPNGSPSYVPHGLPNSYGNPYAQQPVQSPYSPGSFTGSPTSGFNTPQPYQQQHMPWSGHAPIQPRNSQFSPPAPSSSSRDMMPPPPRPNKQEERDEKVSNIDDIGDSLFMSGINLKDEENYLHNTYNNRHMGDSFASNQSHSFGSSTIGSQNSFNLTQGTSFGSQGADGAFAGTLGQPRSQQQIEDEAKRQRELAARRLAEKHQQHLNNQFLLGNCLRNRMHKLGTENAVRLDVAGVYLRNPEPETHYMVNGAATEGIAAVKPSVNAKPESMIDAGAAYEHIISLISLAANERLRGLLDEAFGLARARRYGDHGRVVPPEFADISDGPGKKSQETVVPESVTGTQWDRTQDDAPAEVAATASQTNGEKATPQSVQTVSFQDGLNARLRELAELDREAEKERQKKREARRRRAESAGADDKTPTDTPAETPAASGPIDSVAPVGKISKKEQNKKQKEAQSIEAQSFSNSNQTAAMMALGGKSRKYAWMSGGAASTPTNRFLKTSGSSGTSTPKAQAEPATATIATEKEAKIPSWGDWREDSVDGRGIQLRDWILVLERDGREKKALQKATNKMQ